MKEQFNLSETYRIHFNKKLDEGYDFTYSYNRRDDLREFCNKYGLDPDTARFTITKVRRQELKRRRLDITQCGHRQKPRGIERFRVEF
jgi:hypothetical protein